MKFYIKFVFITVIIFFSFLLGSFFWMWTNHFVDFSVLENYDQGKPSVLIDDQGQVWAKFEMEKREPVKLSQVPKHTINAFVAAEDRDFFNHHGVSFKGIIRSTLVNIKHRRIVQGASTITQQLVKLLFFDSERTFKRKVKEQFLSLIVEKQFTKEQILETYLNHVYFGCGIYGIGAACKKFFGKHVSDINPAESAVLAGVQKCPAVYCPLLNLKKSLARRNLILKIMFDMGFLSNDEYLNYISQELTLFECKVDIVAPHLKEAIRVYVESLYGKEKLYRGGLKIQTTLNRDVQMSAQNAFNKQFNNLRNTIKFADGAVVCMATKTGEIKALVGGYNFCNSQFNRAIQAKRQMGSVFKPFVYAGAIQQGYDFRSLAVDEPIDINNWKPNNYNKKFEGRMTLARALSISNNIVTIKTLIKAGPEVVIDLAKKAGIKSLMQPYPSLALGCLDVNLVDAVAAFNVFANNGFYVEPHYLKWIKDDLGKKIWNYKSKSNFVLSSKIAGSVLKVLSLGIKRYTKRLNIDLGFKAFGKTGTTNDSRTCWFIGASPELTTGIYIGRDDNASLGENVFPVRTVFPIWLDIYKNVPYKEKNFVFDPALKKIYVDWITGEEFGRKVNSDTISLLV